MYFCDVKLDFSIITSVSHVPSEIIRSYLFAAQETFLIMIDVKNRSAVSYFVKIVIDFVKVQKNSIYYKYTSFVSI